MQILREGSTFFLQVAKLGLLVAMSSPYWNGFSAIGEKGADMQKGRDKTQMQREGVVVQNLVLSYRCQGPGPYSNSSALMGSLIMH